MAVRAETTTQMQRSIWPELEPLLQRVEKPARYIGSELNLRPPRHDGAQVKFLFAFPDTYEVGQPNLGLAILYEIVNEQEGMVAERTFAPWVDLESFMRRHGIPLFSLDNHLPASCFDVLAFSCASELVYTNVLNMIDLAGIPVRASERRPEDPLVIAGGHAVHNPEPLADFLDAVVIGDGEEVIVEIGQVVAEFKSQLRRAKGPDSRAAARRDVLVALASLEGVYVPSLYEPIYSDEGELRGLRRLTSAAPEIVEKRTVVSLSDFPYPKNPLVPLTEVVHDRLNVEIFRGCTRGCRFCQAGMITRPVRERPRSQVEAMIADGLSKTGYEDVSLLSLSSADYSGIEKLSASLMDQMECARVSLSLPSLRVDAFTVELATEIQRVKKSGLTFAPEAGTWRMRRVVNKLVTDEDLMAAVEAAFQKGWKRVKLYFMIGLPTERDEDVEAIGSLANEVAVLGRRYVRDPYVTVSVGAFVPKPHTPFQWAPHVPPKEVKRRIEVLKSSGLDRAVKLKWHDPEASTAETLASRGDRRVADVVERVWRRGGTFQEWSEHFDFRAWTRACEELGVSLDRICYDEWERDRVLPWDHISVGLYKEFLWEDWQASKQAGYLQDCRWTPCYDCGVCMTYGVENLVASKTPPAGGSQGTGQRLPEVDSRQSPLYIGPARKTASSAAHTGSKRGASAGVARSRFS